LPDAQAEVPTVRKASGHHPSAWIVWAVSSTCVGLLLRNPWYLGLLGAVVLWVRWRAAGIRPGRSTLQLAGGMLVFPTLLNLLFSRAGDTVLLQLPIPWLGGPYTLEAMLFGAVAGVQIASLVMVMLALGAVVAPTDLLRRTPAGLAPVGVTASIAMTFAPQARRSFAALREAQQVRGYQPRGLRDLPALVTPLVILSLEGAFAVAEGLAARGWGRAGLSGWRRAAVPAGAVLVAFGLGLWAVTPAQAWVTALVLAAGIALLAAAVATAGGVTRYRPDRWRRRDSLLAGISLGVLACFSGVVALAPGLITYYPYPSAALPAFHPALGLAVLLLALPGWTMAHD
jgi:energy-coupling factor transport system permease protein